jgi:hypothetical protein
MYLVTNDNMPRALLQTMGVGDQNLHHVAAAAEAGSLAYVISADLLNSGQPLMTRCMVGAVTGFAYEKYLGTLN